MNRNDEEYDVNLFKPSQGTMVDELAVIIAIMVGWVVMTFGFQFFVWLFAEVPAGEGLLTRLTFLAFPFHYWFTAQFLPLWFIILCIWFNLYIDRVSERHSRRRDRTYE